MRNLKRALSLALASVMLLGMMVVGSSAAQSYPDVDESYNIEAIDVLQKVNVMNGYAEDGLFHPDDYVNRAMMARIMAELLNLDYDYYEAIPSQFTDMGGNYSWAKKYVDACAANGIIYGRGGNIYDPASSVTAVEAASMMMRALGYFQNIPEDIAEGFETATVKQASQISLFKKINGNARDPLTRNQVAQLALNTLEANMVYFTGDMGWEVNGVKTGYRPEYTFRTGTDEKYAAISEQGDATVLNGTSLAQGQHYVQLGEQLYDGDLRLYDSREDDFGRPSRRWEYDGQVIGVYMRKELLRQEYTSTVTGKDLYELLGSEVVKDNGEYKFVITIDGETSKTPLNSEDLGVGRGTDQRKADKDKFYFDQTAMNRTNTNAVGGTGNGVLTQVFVNGYTKTVHISIINTYLAVADSDYNSRRDEVAFTIYGVREVRSDNNVKTLVKDVSVYNRVDPSESARKVSGDDFDIKDIKADDICLVRVSGGEIKVIMEPKVIDDATISSFQQNTYVVANDNRHNYATSAIYDTETLTGYNLENMKNITYCVYLDPYDYLIGLEEVESEPQYVFLTGINSVTENLKDTSAVGNVIFLDGTSKNVTIDMKNSKNAQGRTFSSGDFGWDVKTNSKSDGTNDGYEIRYDTGISSLMNTWCTYSVDDNGVYTLKEVANTKWDARHLVGGSSTEGNVDTSKVGQSHMGGTYHIDGDADNYVYFYSSGDAAPTGKIAGNGGFAEATSTNTLPDEDNGSDTEYVKINKGHVSLDGVVNSNYFKKVYGNDDTIYLSAEVGYLNAAKNVMTATTDTKPAVIITGVSTVSVGVQNTDLTAYNAQAVVENMLEQGDKTAASSGKLKYSDVSDGVYALFNNKGYVIAAVVVGGDDASSSSFAWVSSTKLSREALVNGNWEYDRNVIIDGKAATLTEVETAGNIAADVAGSVGGDNSNVGYNNISFWWYVKTKADGTVKSVEEIKKPGKNGSWTYIYDIDDDTKDGTVVLNQRFNWPYNSGSDTEFQYNGTYVNGNDVASAGLTPYTTFTVRVNGNTLQVESKTGDIRGFAVKSDASIAVVKDEEIYVGGTGVKEYNFKTDIEYFTNDAKANGLKQAVNYLNKSTDFKGYIAAVLVDGRAECVIIYDKSAADVEIGGGIGTSNDVYAVAGDIDKGYGGDLYVIWDDTTEVNNPARTTPATVDEAWAAIAKYLLDNEGVIVDDLSISFAKGTVIGTGHTKTGKPVDIEYKLYRVKLSDWRATIGGTVM